MISTEEFLGLFGHTGIHTFQVGPDRDKVRDWVSWGKVYNDYYANIVEKLRKYNRNAGFVSFTVNATDGEGRKKKNITEIRAFFVDLDGVPLLPVDDYPLTPSVVVNTSPGKYHLYWLVRDVPLDIEVYEHYLKQLAYLFGGCEGVTDISHAMRLPGYFHMKENAYRVNVQHVKPVQYTYIDFLEAFALDAPEIKPKLPPPPAIVRSYINKLKPSVSKEGVAKLADNVRYSAHMRNDTLFKQARALANDVVSREISIQEYNQILTDAGLDAGLDIKEIKTTLRSAMKYAEGASNAN